VAQGRVDTLNISLVAHNLAVMSVKGETMEEEIMLESSPFHILELWQQAERTDARLATVESSLHEVQNSLQLWGGMLQDGLADLRVEIQAVKHAQRHVHLMHLGNEKEDVSKLSERLSKAEQQLQTLERKGQEEPEIDALMFKLEQHLQETWKHPENTISSLARTSLNESWPRLLQNPSTQNAKSFPLARVASAVHAKTLCRTPAGRTSISVVPNANHQLDTCKWLAANQKVMSSEGSEDSRHHQRTSKEKGSVQGNPSQPACILVQSCLHAASAPASLLMCNRQYLAGTCDNNLVERLLPPTFARHVPQFPKFVQSKEGRVCGNRTGVC